MPLTAARCPWARTPASIAYHDREWGVPLHDDRALFELLTLEGAQAGLAWETILAKREGYRRAFAGFRIATVAAFDAADVTRLLGDAGIVRNRAKIRATIDNARAVLAIVADAGSFDAFLWRFVDGVPLDACPRTPAEIPTTTPVAKALSRDLRARGCRFVGPTIAYAFMQATGLVNDHLATCPARAAAVSRGEALRRRRGRRCP